jgi:hypothetical protein
MENDTPQIGSVGYLSDGSIVRLLAKNSDNRFVVEIGRQEEDDEGKGEVFFDGVKTVSRLYVRPPVLAVEKRIAELEQKESALKDAIRELQQKRGGELAAMERLKQFDCLKNIDAYLQGKITHYVVWDRGYNRAECDFRITTPETEKSGNESRSSDLKMLGLYGRQSWEKKGASPDPEWRLTHYSDGSGSSFEYVKPCLSLEEAKQFAAEKLSASLAHYEKESGNEWTLKYLVSSCKRCFYEVPEWLTERLKKAERAAIQAEIDKTTKELQVSQAKLDALCKPQSEGEHRE